MVYIYHTPTYSANLNYQQHAMLQEEYNQLKASYTSNLDQLQNADNVRILYTITTSRLVKDSLQYYNDLKEEHLKHNVLHASTLEDLQDLRKVCSKTLALCIELT